MIVGPLILQSQILTVSAGSTGTVLVGDVPTNLDLEVRGISAVFDAGTANVRTCALLVNGREWPLIPQRQSAMDHFGGFHALDGYPRELRIPAGARIEFRMSPATDGESVNVRLEGVLTTRNHLRRVA